MLMRRDENKVFTWWKDEDCDDLYRGGVFIFTGSLRKGVLTITAVCSKLIFRKVKTQLSHRSSQESNCKMYLFKFQKVFVKIAKCICSNFKMYLSNCKMYLFKFQKVFVQIAKCICPNFGMYLSKLHKVFVKIAKCWQLTPFTKYNY